MATWSELRKLVRWLFRRPEPPPPPGTGQQYQTPEQAEAQRRLLDQAKRLRDTQWHPVPTEICHCGADLPCRARHRVPISRRYWPAGDER